eukprot:NODE_7395_length_480_cov_12.473318_g6952_i0.p1 GENE.NODE_7395_length_480_cov_12.473318_g6952_i0~~NODE_7395_length_480_cov_12.473318_g6952_i0.p1  ORF type:complete len:143 (-),score=20.13 NODE_7395_length_480_cov_12.473318_g6952_i0:22-450(-)
MGVDDSMTDTVSVVSSQASLSSLMSESHRDGRVSKRKLKANADEWEVLRESLDRLGYVPELPELERSLARSACVRKSASMITEAERREAELEMKRLRKKIFAATDRTGQPVRAPGEAGHSSFRGSSQTAMEEKACDVNCHIL